MCIVSMVHDQTSPWVPEIEPYAPPWENPNKMKPAGSLRILSQPTVDLAEFQRLISEFRQMIEAAKFLDQKLNQPDCVDPEKAKLEEKIKQLEAIIAAPPEFVIVTGGKIEPGTYRVIDGKLYKAVD